MNHINFAWLTLNRNCNLRCEWCYAKGTNYRTEDTIDFNVACMVIDWAAQMGIRELTFIGGEPTLYNRLIDLVEYSNKCKLSAGIVTNGIRFSDPAYCQRLLDSGIGTIDLSLKGISAESYLKNTGVDSYEKVLKAINNLSSKKTNFMVSMVLSGDNISEFLNGVRSAKLEGCSFFSFSFCCDFSALETGKQTQDYNLEYNIFHVIDCFMAQYEELHDLTSGNFVLHQTFPLCLWPEDFIRIMSERNQLATSCQFLRRDGLVFDTGGNIVPCNLMYQIKLGELGREFKDAASLRMYLESSTVSNFYEKTAFTYPDVYCEECRDWERCGGGCVSNWLNFSYKEMKERYEKYLNKRVVRR